MLWSASLLWGQTEGGGGRAFSDTKVRFSLFYRNGHCDVDVVSIEMLHQKTSQILSKEMVMFFTVTQEAISSSPDKEQRLLKQLAEDLERVSGGFRPDMPELWDAPLLDCYVITQRKVPALAGYVRKHPVLGDAYVRTSDLWMLSPTLGWARSFSRFYRLGTPG